MADVIGPIIAKQGIIRVLKSIPWDSTYRNVFLPSSEANQYTEITQNNAMIVASFTAQSYSRVSNNVVRIQSSADVLKNCNYLIIENGSGFGRNKKFYCFINNVEYVNVNTCDVTFEIDYFQTYLYDFVFEDSFIEREHSESDEIGDNLEPESIDTGELIVQNINTHTYPLYTSYVQATSPVWYCVVAYVPNYNNTNTTYVILNGGVVDTVQQNYPPSDQCAPLVRNGTISPICFLSFAFPASDISSNTNLLVRIVNKIVYTNGQVIDIYLIPSEVFIDNFQSSVINVHQFTITRPTTFKSALSNETYTNIANKKLYQYPFCKLIVTNNNGQTAEYRWEDFKSGKTNAAFGVISGLQPEPILNCYPAQYRGLNADYENSLYFDAFPTVSWSEDSFTKFWAQNKANLGMSLLGTGISTALMLGTGGMSKAVESGAGEANKDVVGAVSGRQGFTLGMSASRLTSMAGQVMKAVDTPDSAHIQNNSSLIMGLQNRMGFTAYCLGLSASRAKIIDDYFTMYGYACNRVKQPSYKGAHRRKHFNYEKFNGCNLQAQTGAGRGLPAEAQKILEKIFDSGVTVWYAFNEIGDYETHKYDNQPIG